MGGGTRSGREECKLGPSWRSTATHIPQIEPNGKLKGNGGLPFGKFEGLVIFTSIVERLCSGSELIFAGCRVLLKEDSRSG